MQAPGSAATPEQVLRVARLVSGVLILGLVTFAVVVLLVTDRAESEAGLMLAVSAGVLTAGVLVSVVVGQALVAGLGRKRSVEEQDVARAFFTTSVIRAAALEGPGFLCLVVYMIEGHPLALGGAAVACLLMLSMFPTAAAFERFRGSVMGKRGGGLEPR